VRDRVDRPGHEFLELLFVLVGGLQRLVERALEPKRAQLALGHAAQPFRLPERDQVLRAGEQRVGDVGFFGCFADHHERDRVCGLPLDLRDLANWRREAVREEAEQLRVVVVERVGEGVELCDPVTADRVAAVSERSIDELDVVFATAQDDQRYRRLHLGHAESQVLVVDRQCSTRCLAQLDASHTRRMGGVTRSGFYLTLRAFRERAAVPNSRATARGAEP
jgi:hypothetical protein